VSGSTATLEVVTWVAPFGLRLWDPVTNSHVADGLVVTARPAPDPDGVRPVRATVTRSGVFACRGLPGLAAAEAGRGDEAFWASPPATGGYRIEVRDPQGRFLGFSADVTLPARGVVRGLCGPFGSPPSPPYPGVPLFSAPSRTAPAGSATVRADLFDGVGGRPAAWALLEVVVPGQPPARGLADQDGRVVVFLPYPEPSSSPASPPGAAGALSTQTWPDVRVRARYAALPVGPGLPDLCQLLDQPPATLLASESPVVPLGEVTLTYSRELVLRTGSTPHLSLLPSPGSPPPP
jgi:hypothetical protein